MQITESWYMPDALMFFEKQLIKMKKKNNNKKNCKILNCD